MALNKLKFNSINVTPAASEALKFNSSADGFETGSAGGAMTFISKQTASSSSTISFTSGIDSTYKEYIFHFNNIHPATDNAEFSFQGNAAGGSGYNETITSHQFETYHTEDGSSTSLAYKTARDQSQGTGFQTLALPTHEDDNGASGFLHLFNPSSTTFVKHFIAKVQTVNSDTYCTCNFTAGYFNTTSAIDEIQFKMSSGNIDSGTITLYGIN